LKVYFGKSITKIWHIFNKSSHLHMKHNLSHCPFVLSLHAFLQTWKLFINICVFYFHQSDNLSSPTLSWHQHFGAINFCTKKKKNWCWVYEKKA